MSSMLIIVGLSVWMAFVAGGFVWFAWGIMQSIAGRFAARRAAKAESGVATKQESPT